MNKDASALLATPTLPNFDEPYLAPPETFFLAYRGSVAHGMYIPPTEEKGIDDIDLMGFVFGTELNYYGLREWGSRGTKEFKEGRWDVVLYEIRKAVSLLLQGNPNILSMLWVPEEYWVSSSEAALALVGARDLFRGKHVYNAFAGYAYQQLTKMESREPEELREYIAVTAELKHRGAHPNHKGETHPEPDRSTGEGKDVANWDTEKLTARLRSYQKKGENIGYMGDKRKQLVVEHGYDSKNAAHLIRLLRMCIEFMQTGDLLVYRPDAAELLSIKRGEWSLKDVKEHAQHLFGNAKFARDRSTLPEEPNRIAVEELLVKLVRQHLAEAPNGR